MLLLEFPRFLWAIEMRLYDNWKLSYWKLKLSNWKLGNPSQSTSPSPVTWVGTSRVEPPSCKCSPAQGMANSLSSPRSLQLQNTSHPLFRNGDITPAPSNWGSGAYNAARCWEHRVNCLKERRGGLRLDQTKPAS